MQGGRKAMMLVHKVVGKNNYKSSKDQKGEAMEAMLNDYLSTLMRQKTKGRCI
jgi:hypothetical protein